MRPNHHKMELQVCRMQTPRVGSMLHFYQSHEGRSRVCSHRVHGNSGCSKRQSHRLGEFAGGGEASYGRQHVVSILQGAHSPRPRQHLCQLSKLQHPIARCCSFVGNITHTSDSIGKNDVEDHLHALSWFCQDAIRLARTQRLMRG